MPPGEAAVESVADGESGGDHDRGGEGVADQVGGGATGEDGDLGHGEAAESVDDAVGEVGCESDTGGADGEGDLR